MKKIINIFISLLIFIPFISVNAWSCYGSDANNAIKSDTGNFSCDSIEGDNLIFTHNGKEYTNFKYDKDLNRIEIIDNKFEFDSNFEYGIVVVTDNGNSENTVSIYVENSQYIKPTTTTTTTTTADINTKTLTVKLDPNNGGEITTKTCEVTGDNTTCSITLPKIDKETFTGWGTAKSCKEGNIGTIRVEKDITYYACYKENEETSNMPVDLYLKTLSISDKTTNESIDFGTFSIKRLEYSFKVLNEVENLDVSVTVDEGIKVEISGNENLLVGENKIVIKLTDSDNNENEYILNVTRLEEGETINNVHYLSSLVIGGYEIDFNKEKFVYSLTIPSDIFKLEINAIPENEEDIKEIKNNDNLEDGSQIIISVIGEDDTSTDYYVNITKESDMNYLLLIAIILIIILIIVLIILIIIKTNKKKNTQSKKGVNDKIEVLNI